MKSDKIKIYIIEIALITFLLCFVLFSGIFTKAIISIVLLVYMIIINKLIKSYKVKGRYNKKITIAMALIGIVYIAILYILGIYVGFYNATVKFSRWSIINYIIPYIVIIVSIENIRKNILLQDDKKARKIIFIATIILDVALNVNIYNVKTLTDYYILIGITIFSSIANNMLYHYIIIKYRNCKAVITYRIITTIYIYIIPIIPDIDMFFSSILRIVIPYIIYLILEAIYSKKEKNFSITTKTKDIVITSILVFLTGIIIMLVSCKFKYGMLVIGSGSMTGTINKTDVIIYEKIKKDEEIEIGKIIVFKDEGKKIIHRVIDKNCTRNETRYFTKGDTNPSQDEGYRNDKDIIGEVKFRIPYIGYPTILLNEIFK